MHFAHDDTTRQLAERARAFVDEHVMPAEPVLQEQLDATPGEWGFRPIVSELRERARAAGLWNLFLPGEHGAGLTNLQYAPIAEITGWSPRLAPVAFNCAAPDTGNMEVLHDFGTPAQQEKWLEPLLDARIRSAFCMTEPDVASSDATNIGTRIRRDGDSYVVTGRKWWSTGAMSPDAAIFIVMGKTDPDAERHRQQSMILVPRDAPGVRVVRPLTVFGYDDRDHGGHAEVVFDDVRVPAENLLAGEGDGFAIAQARLGPGRIHHCMRALGMGERALALMTDRANERIAFGRTIGEQGVIREWIAEARIELEALRLLVLKTAWLMDTVGNRRAMTEIQAIKIAVPRAVQRILDRAIQVFGAAGVSQDTPLAELFAGVRTLRIADGPDEVHLNSLGRAQLRSRVSIRAAE
ncbi:acyl-CoA dehydrogenase family protein [Microbacterium sp. zg.Y1090]|uniref:acyl-CoA dehydrogenase family protein n=1 Tax=Microbacterium TaxID=33882 RepID=UPI00214CA7CF|nr:MULTISPECIES: acyl-CoA dehydrogenase family protein [unclassified Microbacterium]MCR2813166.1 acyl-CoA dehydrogenase family protein [Microbacterium sp. zg.Y1084]MCR2819479.1 acyl-CoA dehydrogenase family protein [Microbacterium sp. zg.Y1090]MDL5487333.1 acyl-CoA dehydrogenase family protein [Microbacterium sp. zg-Y1211]WIM28452.1 acyl-CoA dehydrogenase family protein [Microbacterium sp. zg-Y1090]